MLMDAAFALLRRNDYESVHVVDILAETGLSTRSFYRHFASKDDLLSAMYRENAEGAAERVATRVAAAVGPRARLETWIDAMLAFVFDRGKLARFEAFRVVQAGWARSGRADRVHSRALLLAPLVAALDEGVADGTFRSPDTARDATSIHAVTWEVVESVREGTDALSRIDARRHVLRFALGALAANERAAGPSARSTPRQGRKL